MDSFISRKRRRVSPPRAGCDDAETRTVVGLELPTEEESTEVKLAMLASLHPHIDQGVLLDILLANDGSVESSARYFSNPQEDEQSPRKRSAAGSLSYQGSLSSFRKNPPVGENSPTKRKTLTKKGRTLHLYSPEDVAAHTPCSIIHNFLPSEDANALLEELLEEAPTFEKMRFKVFDNVVESPHSACFYVHTLEDERKQKTEYLYNGSYLKDVRQITPHMRRISSQVRHTVNDEISTRIKTHYPDGKKLKYQSPLEWAPNAAFVNCYDGGGESVGYHSDQLTYLGPRAVIGSLSLGVAREFRVRRIVPRDNDEDDDGPERPGSKSSSTSRADAEGQIAIHLPHNSLLVMHAEMQEEWKHSIAPALAIDPHPVSGKKRINVTYRFYRESFHPRYTPRCEDKGAVEAGDKPVANGPAEGYGTGETAAESDGAITGGKIESARIRVENIIRSDVTTELLEILELYCELLLARIGLLEAKECDPGLEEAVQSIIYAAPRTDIKELQTARGLLVEKYGKEFALAAMENTDGKVAERVLNKLKVEAPNAELVTMYLREIARTYGVNWPKQEEEEEVPAYEESEGNGDEGDDEPGSGGQAVKKDAKPETPLSTEELSKATPPRDLGPKSPVRVAPPGSTTENVSPRLKLPGPPDLKPGAKMVGRKAKTPPAEEKSLGMGPKPSSGGGAGGGGVAKGVVGGKIPDVDELAARFAQLKK
ncbi:MAG: carboxy methyl transferase for protein phosphatase 2A [Chaenotheca gracillima]|nr:MAG: carboxy methyl transferase for protein phosphatase 2A [Chaenotheca gracillima]